MTEHPSVTQIRTLELIDRIEERANAASEGPWFREYSDVVGLQPDPRQADQYDDPQNIRIVRGADHLDKKDRQGIANADFIANARVDVPALIAIARRQAEQLANVRSLTAEIGGSDNFLNIVIARGLRRALGDEPKNIVDADEKD